MGNAHAAARLIEDDTVIRAHNIFALTPAGRQRRITVRATVVEGYRLARRRSKHRDGLAANRAGNGLVGQLARKSGRVPLIQKKHGVSTQQTFFWI
jgi:hypothetical protein